MKARRLIWLLLYIVLVVLASLGLPGMQASAKPTLMAAPDIASPWKDVFSEEGPYKSVKDPVNGPWIYKDETLSVRVDKLTSRGVVYFRADIYTKGPLPYGGFANRDASGRKTLLPYKIARQYGAILAITGDYVTWKNNPKGVMIRDGKVFYDKAQAPTMAILPSGELRVWAPGKVKAAQLLELGVRDAYAFGPILVQDGKPGPGLKTHRLHVGNFRAAVGMVEPNHYIWITSKGSFTLEALAKLFLAEHCTVAFNLDGGHSATMVFMGEQLYQSGRGQDNLPQRPLPDVLLIGHSPFVPDAAAPVYCDGVRVNTKNKPAPFEGLLK